MTFSIHGLAVARGIAIGRAVLVASSRVDVAHYFIEPQQIEQELERINQSRHAVMLEVQRIQKTVPKDAPPELAALLEVHLMLLQDEMLADGVKHWVTDRLYNAEWALTSQLEVVSRQFDDMEDAYLRERKGDLEQVVERLLRHMKGLPTSLPQPAQRKGRDHHAADIHRNPRGIVPWRFGLGVLQQSAHCPDLPRQKQPNAQRVNRLAPNEQQRNHQSLRQAHHRASNAGGNLWPQGHGQGSHAVQLVAL